MSPHVSRAKRNARIFFLFFWPIRIVSPCLCFFGFCNAMRLHNSLYCIALHHCKMIGRLSLKHVAFDPELYAREKCLQFCAAVGPSAHCFVFELGSINEEPHLHFYLESAKSADTVRRNLIKFFELPPKAYSLKAADAAKLDTYFVYLAKVRTV